MIESLRLEDLAIVDRAELELGPGLTVLTGETGAGKSIVLGALALLAGARADPEGVRDGSESAVVEAVFRTQRLPELEAELVERGIELEEHELIVRRSVARGGRSRAWLGGQLVPASVLAEALRGRVEISSQHDSQRLRRREVHGLLLDRIGGLEDRRAAVERGYAALRALDAELEALRQAGRQREQRVDFLGFQVREIDEAKLDAESVDGLRVERSRLAHAERLREEGGAALARLSGDPSGDAGSGASDLLGEAARRLAALESFDPALGALAERLAGAEAEVRDAGLELERCLDGIEADPARLDDVERRLHQIEKLQRKYGATVEDVLRFRDEAAAELAALEGADAREAEILREREPLRAALEADAVALSRGRGRAARALAKRVQASLRELAMAQARFEVALDPVEPPPDAPCGPGGRELPEFRFSANAGEPLRPLRKVASGGELSRAFLAVKRSLREADAGMVLVFDEVDAGVGGRAADRVGRCLVELAEHHQVLCITHLPQVAAAADAHFRVEKSEEGGRTLARVTPVRDEERVEEIARMAGGESVSEATRAHARELLAARSRA